MVPQNPPNMVIIGVDSSPKKNHRTDQPRRGFIPAQLAIENHGATCFQDFMSVIATRL